MHDFVKRFKYKGPVFEISALTREGCEQLTRAVYQHIKAQQAAALPAVELDPVLYQSFSSGWAALCLPI